MSHVWTALQYQFLSKCGKHASCHEALLDVSFSICSSLPRTSDLIFFNFGALTNFLHYITLQ